MAQEELHAIEKRKTRIVYFNSIAHQLDFRTCLTYAVEVIYSCIAAKYNRSKANRNETKHDCENVPCEPEHTEIKSNKTGKNV